MNYLYRMSTITLDVPDTLVEYKTDTVRFIAAKLYEAGKLSLGQAAEMVNLTKPVFVEILGDYGVALINYPASEMLRDASRI